MNNLNEQQLITDNGNKENVNEKFLIPVEQSNQINSNSESSVTATAPASTVETTKENNNSNDLVLKNVKLNSKNVEFNFGKSDDSLTSSQNNNNNNNIQSTRTEVSHITNHIPLINEKLIAHSKLKDIVIRTDSYYNQFNASVLSNTNNNNNINNTSMTINSSNANNFYQNNSNKFNALVDSLYLNNNNNNNNTNNNNNNNNNFYATANNNTTVDSSLPLNSKPVLTNTLFFDPSPSSGITRINVHHLSTNNNVIDKIKQVNMRVKTMEKQSSTSSLGKQRYSPSHNGRYSPPYNLHRRYDSNTGTANTYKPYPPPPPPPPHQSSQFDNTRVLQLNVVNTNSSNNNKQQQNLTKQMVTYEQQQQFLSYNNGQQFNNIIPIVNQPPVSKSVLMQDNSTSPIVILESNKPNQGMILYLNFYFYQTIVFNHFSINLFHSIKIIEELNITISTHLCLYIVLEMFV